MTLLVFSVFDTKAEAFLRPYCAETRGLALRAFTDAVRDPNHEMHRHAEDYTLFQVASFDQETGKVSPLAAPISIVTAITLKEAA